MTQPERALCDNRSRRGSGGMRLREDDAADASSVDLVEPYRVEDLMRMVGSLSLEDRGHLLVRVFRRVDLESRNQAEKDTSDEIQRERDHRLRMDRRSDTT